MPDISKNIQGQSESSRQGLPGWTYQNRELFDLEMEDIFLSQWIFVGHISELATSGDYLAHDLVTERILVVRDDHGEIRAFNNLCRHRASRLVSDHKGNCGKSFVCPFHGWTYNLDGSLKQVPRANKFPQLDFENLGLIPLRCEIWQGIIFVSFSEHAKPIAELFAPAMSEIAPYQIEQMQPYDQQWRYDLNCDWKSMMDIDSEGYHVPIGHPELYDLVGNTYFDQQFDNGLNRSAGSFQGGKFKRDRVRAYVDALPKDSYLPDDLATQWIYWGLFPGIVITLFPDLIEIYQIHPTGYQTSVMTGKCYAMPDNRDTMETARKLNRQLNNGIGDEDINLMLWSAQGMRSRAYQTQVLGDCETLLIGFHDTLRQQLPVVTLGSPPAPGTVQIENQRLKEANSLIAV